ncbi:hypothetical protein C8J57DRAFT_1704523 [Mycena rebaudengoi]|nr:hypothetical protein C8J57DRAFT_1704523 [Mycena rebaudengoi]
MSLSSQDLQRHLYASFVHSRTPDVAIRVKGASWHAIYRLHRVVLIQAGFFSSLFTAGFAESSPKPEVLDIVFDDANITRSAFEFSIARLYGGGPPLYIFPSLVPSTSQPLTSAFPFISVNAYPSTPPNHQPGTPRFLLSLLATCIYLSIPSLAAQALSSILSTVGPYTVLQYLDFALGKPIGPPDPHWREPEAAVGLENVAELIQHDTFSHSDRSLSSDDNASLSSFGSLDGDSVRDYRTEKVFHYGAVSDKIGEAAACWLVRWGPDILSLEERKANCPISSPDSGSPHIARRRAQTVGAESHPVDYSAVPTIWDRGGLSVQWICAVASADTLFVRGERERYDFVRAVVELRRRHGVIKEEEDEWTKLFEKGIYYCHMPMEDVMVLSRDTSPSTKQPFVSIAVLQAAHWKGAILRQQITAHPASPSPAFEVRPSPAPTPGSPIQREKELGITQTSADILARLSAGDPTLDKVGPYYLVPGDSSQRIGDNGGSVRPSNASGPSLSMDELFNSSFASSNPASPTAPHPPPLTRPLTSEANFFGIQTSRYTAADCVTADPSGKARFTTYPPFRFGVEFWDAESIRKEKERLYSHTVWYGGSHFNSYIQVVRRKGGVQLGIYLHRQSALEIPGASSPAEPQQHHKSVVRTQAHTHTRGPSLPAIVLPSPASPTHYSPSIHPSTRSSTPVSTSFPSGGSPLLSASGIIGGGNALPATAPPTSPVAPYRDPRGSISAYFTISCASATGTTQTRFASAPDVFSVSQSWGWKSSSLRTEEYMEVAEREDDTAAVRGREVSIRACVVLGLV